MKNVFYLKMCEIVEERNKVNLNTSQAMSEATKKKLIHILFQAILEDNYWIDSGVLEVD